MKLRGMIIGKEWGWIGIEVWCLLPGPYVRLMMLLVITMEGNSKRANSNVQFQPNRCGWVDDFRGWPLRSFGLYYRGSEDDTPSVLWRAPDHISQNHPSSCSPSDPCHRSPYVDRIAEEGSLRWGNNRKPGTVDLEYYRVCVEADVKSRTLILSFVYLFGVISRKVWWHIGLMKEPLENQNLLSIITTIIVNISMTGQGNLIIKRESCHYCHLWEGTMPYMARGVQYSTCIVWCINASW